MPVLGALGCLVLDSIRTGGGEEVRSLGGLAYSLAAFGAVAPAGWRVRPIVKVGRDARKAVGSFLDALPGLESPAGLTTVPERNPRVELRDGPDGARWERLRGGVPGWRAEELLPLARGCDALYLNFIVGTELEAEELAVLRTAFSGSIYGDLHNLLLGRDAEGRRPPRVPGDWRRYPARLNHLQLNEDELRLLAGGEGEEPRAMAASLVEEPTETVFVTRGERGAVWFAREGGGATEHEVPAAIGRDRPGETGRGRPGVRSGEAPVRPASGPGADPIGCGDVWGMACFLALLEGHGPARAAAAANRLARANAGRTGTEGLVEHLRRATEAG